MRKKILASTMAVVVGVGLAPAAYADTLDRQGSVSPVTQEIVEAGSEFQECVTGEFPVPESTTDGEKYGAGISEKITDDVREIVNEGLTSTGREALPDEAYALRYLDSGAILVLDKDEELLGEITRYQPRSLIRDKGINEEAKGIIEACLGIGLHSGALTEELTQALASPRNAAKFVIRRIGVGAAVGCAGGIIWRYV